MTGGTGGPGPARILLLFAHPAFHRSRANRRLVEAVVGLPGLTWRDLYEEYPDFNVDVAAEQALLSACDVLVLQHPLYWYSVPALLKEWLDLVLEYGFAYGAGGDRLHGKRFLSAITTGGGPQTYGRGGVNGFTVHELLAPLRQTARFCGMRWLPPFVVHGTLQEGDAYLRRAADAYRAALTGLRDGTLDAEALPEGRLLNDAVPPAEGTPDAR